MNLFGMKVGLPELLIVLAIVLLLFGVGRLGKLGKDLGEGVNAFRRGLKAGAKEEGKEEGKEEESTEAD